MANAEKELNRFINDYKYREKVLLRLEKEHERQHDQIIKQVESEINKLSKERDQEIKKIEQSRWERIAGGKLLINRTEGKVRFNQTEALFSSVHGAEINVVYGCRVVTSETGKSKKKASVGGAIVGGMLMGPVGAVAGGVGLGKTKTTGKSVTNQIPTCTHLGVRVNLDGFVSEIVLSSRQVDQSSLSFSNLQAQAQSIVAHLGQIAKLPVPTHVILPKDEESVKHIEARIKQRQEELNKITADTSTYKIPDMYKAPEHRSMLDDEYLRFLNKEDVRRFAEEKEHKQENLRQKKHVAESNPQTNVSAIIITAIDVLYKIIFSFSSLVLFLFAVVIIPEGNLISGIILIVTGIVTNPFVVILINKRLLKYPRWVAFIMLIVGFFAGVIFSL